MERCEFELNRGLWREVRPRVGERARVGITVRWRLPEGQRLAPAYEVRPRWSAPAESVTQPAVLHDLSVSGARLLVPADDAIAVGATLEVEIGGLWATAQVVWVEPSEHPSARWCGAAFRDPEPRFLSAVSRVVATRTADGDASLSWEQGGAGGYSS